MAERTSYVRPAAAPEAPRLLEIAEAVQNKLTRTGSLQQIAGYARQNIAERIKHGEMFVLEVSGCLLGSAFVEPVTPERFPHIASWQAIPDGCSARFLYGLILHPEHQNHGWGRVLLRGLCQPGELSAPTLLLLDCWAGNAKLRRFYTDAGFDLHGVFPEDDYEVAVFRRIDGQKTQLSVDSGF